MTNLNFKISEPIHSDEAVKHHINNMPDINSLDNMLELIVYCLQPLRDKLVGGVDTSQHTKGQAVDFTVSGMTVAQVVNFVKSSGIEYDQLINEYDNWTLMSFNKGSNRRRIIIIGFICLKKTQEAPKRYIEQARNNIKKYIHEMEAK